MRGYVVMRNVGRPDMDVYRWEQRPGCWGIIQAEDAEHAARLYVEHSHLPIEGEVLIVPEGEMHRFRMRHEIRPVDL